MDLNKYKDFEKIDKNNLYEKAIGLPEQVEESIKIMESFPAIDSLAGKISNIVFAGMGGSRISGDIFKNYMSYEVPVPIDIIGDYIIPEYVRQDTLFVSISYSGNTAETLSATKMAKQREANLIGITTGGKLEKVLKSVGLVIKIPPGFPPRHGLGYLFSCLLILMEKANLISNRISSLLDLVPFLVNYREKLKKEVPVKENFAKQIAQELNGRIAVIYSNARLSACAKRWKTQLNENSKQPAKCELFPELVHNEIVSWETVKKFENNLAFIMLRDFETEFEIRETLKYSLELLKEQKTIQIHSVGSSLLERMFSLVFMGDMVSYYLAMLNGIDPMPIKNIDYIKSKIKRS